MTTPFVNPELKLIYTIAKGESIIRVFDYNNNSLMKKMEFKALENNLISAHLNRHCLDKKHNEKTDLLGIQRINRFIMLVFISNLKVV